MANNTSPNNPVPNFYRASAADFKKIPGSPIAYWITQNIRACFLSDKVGNLMPVRSGLTSGDKPKFTRAWWEVGRTQIGFNMDGNQARTSSYKWFPHNAGGEARRWYGNQTVVINWWNDGEEIRKQPNSTIRNSSYYFKKGITWTDISSSFFVHGCLRAGLFSKIQDQ